MHRLEARNRVGRCAKSKPGGNTGVDRIRLEMDRGTKKQEVTEGPEQVLSRPPTSSVRVGL